MQPLAEPRLGRGPLLTIDSASGRWGIPSAAVASVEPASAAVAEATVSLLTLLGVATPRESLQPRVLVLQVGAERVPLLVHGALTLLDASATDLLPLPAAVQLVTPLVSHLAVVDGKPALFVVAPERLLQAARAFGLDSPSHDSARGSSC